MKSPTRSTRFRAAVPAASRSRDRGGAYAPWQGAFAKYPAPNLLAVVDLSDNRSKTRLPYTCPALRVARFLRCSRIGRAQVRLITKQRHSGDPTPGTRGARVGAPSGVECVKSYAGCQASYPPYEDSAPISISLIRAPPGSVHDYCLAAMHVLTIHGSRRPGVYRGSRVTKFVE
jgi:hypothetical protein